MDKEIQNAIRAADAATQYDEAAKQLLGHKYILAYILLNTIEEFRGMAIRDVAACIEGEPQIGVVPVDGGLTNTEMKTVPPGAAIIQAESSSAENHNTGAKIIGLNTENSEHNEGLIRFDIIFYVRMKTGLSQIIINVEAQKDDPTEYDILNRAVFYVSRLIASQKERDFTGMHFNDIKRVFSIWICMNQKQNSMNYLHLSNDTVLGSQKWKGRLDLINIIMIGLSNELPEHDEKYELHRLLGALFSKNLSADERITIIENEYDISVKEDTDLRKDVNVMCNLSQGIWEDGQNTAKTEVIMNMHHNHFTLEQIALAVQKDINEVKTIIEENELAPV